MIEVKNLSRRFGNIVAVDGINFRVAKGDVLGFLGPNGAGKSTTMKMITGFLSPSTGSVRVGGVDVSSQSSDTRQKIGYLPENAPLYSDMRVSDFLGFVASIRGVPKELSVQRVVSECALEEVLGQKIETLSKGFKRRVGLAQALIHDPEYLIMDEPTDGLDPNQKYQVRDLIHRMAADKCIILSTHILEEVEEVCNRVVVINKGQIVADDTPENLKHTSESCGNISISFKGKIDQKTRNFLSKLDGIEEIDEFDIGVNQSAVTLVPASPDNLFGILSQLEPLQVKVEAVNVSEGKLDEVFRRITN